MARSCANLQGTEGELLALFGMTPVSATVVQDVAADELVFTEPPLVAGQHATNRQDALVCSHCFSMIGSIEQQIAHRLLARASAGEGLQAHPSCSGLTAVQCTADPRTTRPNTLS